jgi:hypothetical protein
MAAKIVFSFYFLEKDNTTLDRKATDMTKRRQHKTNTHKMHSAQLACLAYVLLAGYSLSIRYKRIMKKF